MSELVGKTVKEVRLLSEKESGFDEPVTGIIFEDGSVIFPSRDDEGNGKGTLFGTIDGKECYIFACE